MNRREFAASLAAPVAARPAAPNGRIGIGIIGCGGMGRNDLADFARCPEVQVTAVCDVFRPNLELALKMTGGKAEGYADYRRVLDRKDVDAVVIATPDHWHALMTVDACRAGKDVYVEKPISHNIREGRLMVEAARRHKRVVQVGIQQRSGAHFQRAVKAVHEGRIGAVHYAECWNHRQASPKGMGFPPDAATPAGLDWDLWLGPAPGIPYNPARRNFRMFWDYAGGELTNWGVHLVDVVHWALQADAPLSAVSSGGKYYIKDCRDCPETQETLFEYPGFLLKYSTLAHSSFGPNGDSGARPFGSYGILLHGTLGTLFIDRAGYQITPQMTQQAEKSGAQGSRDAYDDLTGVGLYYTANGAAERGATSLQHMPHVRNFLDCMKTRERPAGDIETGHRGTAVCLLGNIAYRTGRKLLWDAAAERITNAPEANALLTRAYRAPWHLEGM